MGEFLATPFLVIAQASLWLASFINGNGYVLMEVEETDDNGDYDGE